MKNELKLFIGGKEVEFSSDPKILFNYKETELHNPTVVRNSWSKQVEIEGTPRNNDIFGNIWNLDYYYDGSIFNPIKKTDFQLFMDGALFQKGYCKLDKVTRTSNTITYSFTLYGSLGSFFYNLAYDQDDESSQKKTLASLKYNTDDRSEPELDFTIDKDSVYNAWGKIAGGWGDGNPRWDVINFIPALNGIPNDFDASKVLINFNDLNSQGQTGFQSGKREEGVDYRPVANGMIDPDGYSLGDAEEDLQEWQTRDLRSYNQRPGISMYRIIQACCQPENNGGYQVKLDDHFFHVNNPYYFDAWVTLPMLKDLDGVGGGETYSVTGATVERQGESAYYDIDFDTQLAKINNVSMNLSVRFTPDTTTSATELYGDRKFLTRGVVTLQNNYVKQYERNTGVILQLLGYGANGTVVAQSKAYLLGGKKNYPDSSTPMWNDFWVNGQDGVQPEYVFLDGYWKLIDGQYIFVDRSGNPTNINFSFTSQGDITNIVLKVYQPTGEFTHYYGGNEQHYPITNASFVPLYTSRDYNTNGRYTYQEARSIDRVDGSWSFVIEDLDALVTDYEGMFSGTKITKERLLSGEYTPADYLLSYCKLFGLYFYYDSTEEADDPERYPSGVVHIMDRDTFYTDEVVNLEKLVDWDKKVEIIPAMAATKWYRFDVEHVESELEDGYAEQFGRQYGSQYVNTNFNFNSDTTDLYDGNVFKSAIMALEKDKYYKKTSLGLPVYQYNGFNYQLYARTSPTDEFSVVDIDFPQGTTTRMGSINSDYEFYDAFPKLELHGADNGQTDGSNVLVFLKGSVGDGSTDYWLTDDVDEMVSLNDGTPCWILTRSEYDGSGNRIARNIHYFPFFTRDLIPLGTYGNITHSWNFGHPQVIYSPDTYSTDNDSIYDKCWKNYIADLYDVDSRKLTCYVRAEFDGRPWPYWLRRFYWFQNSIWRLNEIKDLNPASFDTTKMEFIKVQDMANYELEKIEYQGGNAIVLDQSSIPCSGGTITGHVYLQAGGGWYASDYMSGEDEDGNFYGYPTEDVMVPTRDSGTDTTFTITLPASTASTPITWEIAVEDDFDRWIKAYFTQESCPVAKQFEFRPEGIMVNSDSGSTSTTLIVSGYEVVEWTIPTPTWATITRNGNTISISYEANPNTTDRSISIGVAGRDGSETVTTVYNFIQRGYVPPTPPTGQTWTESNAGDYEIYGNLIDGSGNTFAGVELDPREDEVMTNELPQTIAEVWLAVYGLDVPANYEVWVYNGRTGAEIIASHNGSDFVGTGSIEIQENDYINFVVRPKTRSRAQVEPEDTQEEPEADE